jgi:hypothetical protein
LTLCDQVIVKEGTRKVTFVGTFRRLQAAAFPFIPERFCVVSRLTGSQGEGELTLTLTNLETDEEVSLYSRRVMFPDRFAEGHVVVRLSECRFAAPGAYMFTLMVDGEWIAHRRVVIQETESDS